jgi:hypothetical protein
MSWSEYVDFMEVIGILNDYPVYATIATGDLARARPGAARYRCRISTGDHTGLRWRCCRSRAARTDSADVDMAQI